MFNERAPLGAYWTAALLLSHTDKYRIVGDMALVSPELLLGVSISQRETTKLILPLII